MKADNKPVFPRVYMLGIGAELLIIVVVALVVFGPKELPRAMRSAGVWSDL